jgi:hypothetical protein
LKPISKIKRISKRNRPSRRILFVILVGSALLVGAKPGKRRRQSHQIGNRKEKARPRLTLGGDSIAVAVTENQGLPHEEMTLVLRNPNPGVESVTIPGM